MADPEQSNADQIVFWNRAGEGVARHQHTDIILAPVSEALVALASAVALPVAPPRVPLPALRSDAPARRELRLKRERVAESLIATARTEFLRYGFDGTDVSRIARRSSLATATFYRHFKDKGDIFTVVFRLWIAEERGVFHLLLSGNSSPSAIVNAWVEQQRTLPIFRRSVRRLSHEDPRVRRALADSRLSLLEELRPSIDARQAGDASLAFDILQFEQLTCAIAEGDFAEMGLDDACARDQVTSIVRRWRLGADGAFTLPPMARAGLPA
jgi:AcrR family transcriptional regulator